MRYLAIVITAIFLSGCESQKPHRSRMGDFGTANVEVHFMRSEHGNNGDFGGFSQSDGMEIVWRGTADAGASTLDVVNATIGRMQFEQGSDMASDKNARALAHMMLARQELEGKQTKTDDGLSILE